MKIVSIQIMRSWRKICKTDLRLVQHTPIFWRWYRWTQLWAKHISIASSLKGLIIGQYFRHALWWWASIVDVRIFWFCKLGHQSLFELAFLFLFLLLFRFRFRLRFGIVFKEETSELMTLSILFFPLIVLLKGRDVHVDRIP